MNKLLTPVLISSVFMMSSCATLSDVDSMIYNATNSISSTDHITGKRSFNFNNRNEQIIKSDANARKILKSFDSKGIKYNEALNPQDYARVQRILSRVLAVSHFKDEKWTAVLIDKDTFNAFVMGGTYVFVHSGLLKQSKNDDEIAAVIGHEIAHVTANHIYEEQAYQLVTSVLGSKSAQRSDVRKSYTSKHEEEADKIGILYSALAGYNPNAASELWGRLFEESGNSGMYIQDHPIKSERKIQTANIAKKVNAYYKPNRQNPQHEALLVKNTLWDKSKKASIETGKGGGVFTLLETLGDGYIKRESAKREARRQQTRRTTIKMASDLINIVESKATDAKTWQVAIHYKGPHPLQKLILVADMDGKDKSVYEFNKPVVNSKLFYASFSSDKVNEYTLKPSQVKITVDDASF